MYLYKGKKYHVTPKEKAILVKQEKLLDELSFNKLFNDFELKEI